VVKLPKLNNPAGIAQWAMPLIFITNAIFKMDNQKFLYKKLLPLTLLVPLKGILTIFERRL
jgi:hypothetical protein